MAEHENFSEDAIYLTVRTYDDGKSVVMDAATDTFYVKKTLSEYNASAYEYLKTHEDIQIPAVYSAKEEDGKLTVIEEFIHGKKLDEILAGDSKLSFLDRKRILFAVCQGLNFLHSADPKIVHGDLKPSDILIMDDGTVKLTGYNTAATDVNADIAALGALIRKVLPESAEAMKIAEAADASGLSVTEIKESIGKLADPNDRRNVPGFGSKSIGIRIISWAVLAAAVAAVIFGICRYQRSSEEELKAQETAAATQKEESETQEDASASEEVSSGSMAAASEVSEASNGSTSVSSEVTAVSSGSTSAGSEAAETSSGSASTSSEVAAVSSGSTSAESEAVEASSESTSAGSEAAAVSSESASASSVSTETSSGSVSTSSEVSEASSGSTSASSEATAVSSGSTSVSSEAAAVSTGSTSVSSEVAAVSSGSTSVSSETATVSSESTSISSEATAVSSESASVSSEVSEASSGSKEEADNAVDDVVKTFEGQMRSAAVEVAKENDAVLLIEKIKKYMDEADAFAKENDPDGTDAAEKYHKKLITAGINAAARLENCFKVSGSFGSASEALRMYDALGNYTEDAGIASQDLLDCINRNAAKAMENGKLNAAEKLYAYLSGLSYDGAADGLNNVAYQRALRVLEAGDLLKAADMFDELSGYKDADEQAAQCRSHYLVAVGPINNLESGIEVNWVPIAEADGYFVTMDGSVTVDVGPEVTSYVFTEANTNGQEYSFNVAPYFIGKDGNKDKGAELPAITWTYLEKMVMHQLTSDRAGEITVTWTPNSYAGYYEVAYGLSPELTSSVVIMYMGDQPVTQTITGLVPATYYYFKVRSAALGTDNKVYTSAWSDTVPIIARDYAVGSY